MATEHVKDRYCSRKRKQRSRTINSEESRLAAWGFNVIDSPQVNAFALPDGRVVVFRGLMELLQSDDELAAIIGMLLWEESGRSYWRNPHFPLLST